MSASGARAALARWTRRPEPWLLLGVCLALLGAYHLGVGHGVRRARESVVRPVAAPPATPPPAVEAPPEVWVRLAGLNVWVAGHREPSGDALPRIVVMLHGYGKPRAALLSLAEREAERFDTTFLFPEAPVALDWRRRAWWQPRRGDHGLVVADRAAAVRQIVRLLGEVHARFGVKSEEIVLAGFSQGATLALEVALALAEPLGGLALLSAKLDGPSNAREPTAERGDLERLRAVPVLVAHGRHDLTAPFDAADALARRLRRLGVDLTWQPHEGGHVVPQAVQKTLARFIRCVTPRAGSSPDPRCVDVSAATGRLGTLEPAP